MNNTYFYIFWMVLLSSQLNNANAELSSHLHKLQANFLAQQQLATPFKANNSTAHVINDYVVVDITVKGDAEQLKARLAKIGMIHFSQYKQRLSGALPISQLSSLEQMTQVSWATSAQAQTQKSGSSGFVFNTAGPAMFTDVVRKQYNVSGKGVSIGVLSDSYNCLGTAENDIATGDLPNDIQILKEYPFCEEGLTDEGRAMMQLIHDIAPDAKLIFYTAAVSSTDFAQGIMQLAKAGAQIIVDDIRYLTMPMFQEGPIAQAVNEVTASGVSYFSAAGNYARMSYENDFFPGTEPLSNDSAHDFGRAAGGDSSRFYQRITVPPGRSIRISLQWDDPSEISGGQGAKTDLDMFLLDSSLKRVVRTSEDSNIGHDPVEFLSYQSPDEDGFETTFHLYISHRAGPVPKHLKYIVFTSIATEGFQPAQLKVLNVDGTQFFFLNNDLMESGTGVIALFVSSIQQYQLLPVQQFISDITANLNGNGGATINYADETYQIGFNTNNPIWYVPDGFTATIKRNGQVLLFPDGNEFAAAQIEEFSTNSSTIFGHPNAAGAIAVGAINYQQTPWFATDIENSLIEHFSSAGGTPIIFDNLGNRLPVAEYRNKPEIVAPDGSDTTFFPLGDIEKTDSDGNQLPNFFGTSAAAPHAAAMAALMLEAFPQLTPDDIKQAMMKGSLDLHDPNQDLQNDPVIINQPCGNNTQFDWLTGCGLIQADLIFEQADKNTDSVFLTLKPSASNITAGIAFEYHFKLINFSPIDLQNVRIRATQLPEHVNFLDIDGCIDIDTEEVSCRLETVAAGETKDVIIYVMPTNNPEGQFVFQADLLTSSVIDLSHTKIDLQTPIAQIAGDFNFDGCVDLSDWSLLFAAMRAGGDFNKSFDLTGDGFIGIFDLTKIESLYSNPPSGEACL